MAIIKTVPVGGSGIAAAYWRIIRVHYEIEGDPIVTVTLAGYRDTAAREDDCQPIPGAARSYDLTPADFPKGTEMGGIPLAVLYPAIAARAAAQRDDLANSKPDL